MRSAEDGETGKAWTRRELETAVASYLRMLRMQELGQTANKAEFRRRLHQELPARTPSSIEYKHRNISAALMDLGVQPLIGYRPLYNYQQQLLEVLAGAIRNDRGLDDAAMRQVEMPAEAPELDSFEGFVVDVPRLPRERAGKVREPRHAWHEGALVKRDYLAREAQNRSLGLAGEVLVLEYESRRLHGLGAKALAERIEHVSRTRGDGAGFDILSFDADGRERFIEVKTTAYIAETPFFVSRNEVAFSHEYARQFHLYRLFEFRQRPRMFALPGALHETCQLDPVTYRACAKQD